MALLRNPQRVADSAIVSMATLVRQAVCDTETLGEDPGRTI
jgi:hypothetical protein